MPWSLELNPPNLLTLARIGMTPFVAQFVLQHQCSRALMLLAIAGATDALDGFLARRFDWKTQTGAYLDPIADKLLLTSLYICLGLAGLAPLWLVWLVVGRDLLILSMVGVAFAFTSLREFPPSVWGKISTIVQILTALVLVMSCVSPVPGTGFAVAATAAATLISGLHYVVRGWGMLRNA